MVVVSSRLKSDKLPLYLLHQTKPMGIGAASPHQLRRLRQLIVEYQVDEYRGRMSFKCKQMTSIQHRERLSDILLSQRSDIMTPARVLTSATLQPHKTGKEKPPTKVVIQIASDILSLQIFLSREVIEGGNKGGVNFWRIRILVANLFPLFLHPINLTFQMRILE